MANTYTTEATTLKNSRVFTLQLQTCRVTVTKRYLKMNQLKQHLGSYLQSKASAKITWVWQKGKTLPILPYHSCSCETNWWIACFLDAIYSVSVLLKTFYVLIKQYRVVREADYLYVRDLGILLKCVTGKLQFISMCCYLVSSSGLHWDICI